MPFLLFAVVAAVTPGPSNIMLTAAGAHAGIWKGLPCLFGVTAGMGLMMFVVPVGLGTVVLSHPRLLAALHWCGAAVLLWMSWKIATSTSHIDLVPDASPVGFLGAAIFQWVNPKSWLVSASVAGTFLRPDAGSALVQAACLGGLFVLAALPSCFLWLAFGAAVQHVLQERRRLRVFNIAMGVLLALSIVLILR
jgi:threonine/homoserine/homoserine lactone efflux protein